MNAKEQIEREYKTGEKWNLAAISSFLAELVGQRQKGGKNRRDYDIAIHKGELVCVWTKIITEWPKDYTALLLIHLPANGYKYGAWMKMALDWAKVLDSEHGPAVCEAMLPFAAEAK